MKYDIKVEMNKMDLLNWYIVKFIQGGRTIIDKWTGKILEQTRNVIIFEQKNRLLAKIDDCMVCQKEEKLIPFECGHYVCNYCYVMIMSENNIEKICPMCRLEL